MAQYDGVIDTLALLYQRGHPIGVVTSKGNMMMERGLKFIGADDYIEVAIGYDSVHIHKPDPFPVRAALEKLEYQASRSRLRRRLSARHKIRERRRRHHDRGAVGPFRRDQLEPYKPTYFLDDIKDLPPLLDRIAAPEAG